MSTNFQNLPDTSTPINATNLNSLNNIVASGSDTNGYYIKYDDGTMICVGRKETGTITWTQDGTGFIAGAFNFSNFPETFYSAPYVVKSVEYATPNNRYISLNGQGAPTTTNAGSFNVQTYWAATNANVRAVYIAIGRWKA